MASFKVVFVVLMFMDVVAAPIVSAITCGQVTTNIAGCLTYLQKDGTPSANYCSGVKGLAATPQTTADRQAVCNCVKGAASKIQGLHLQNAEFLPGKCGVNIHSSSSSTNCDTSYSTVFLLHSPCPLTNFPAMAQLTQNRNLPLD